MDILALTRYDRTGSSSRYRFHQFFPTLRASGLTIEEAPLFASTYVGDLYFGDRRLLQHATRGLLRRLGHLLSARRFAALWVEKEVLPFVPTAVEHLLVGRRTRMVVDYDDATFHRYDLNDSAWVRLLLGRKVDKLMASADAVVAGNSYIAARAIAAGARYAPIVPTVIDITRYHVRSRRQHRDDFIIGWLGSPATQSHLLSVARALHSFCRSHRARVVAIGAHPSFALPGVPLEVRPWSEETEVQLLHEVDVGIMPLPDAPWERGKCGLKLIQYMGCGLPVVASPVGANADIVIEGDTGFLAKDAREWAEALHRLAISPQLRFRMGDAGRARAEARYSVGVVAPTLAAILRTAALPKRG